METNHLIKNNNIQIVDEQISNEKVYLFQEIQQHILADECPSNYLNDISHRKIFKETPFSMLLNLKETQQSPTHHPEGNAWKHTMLVLDEAAKVKGKSKDSAVFMWAALLHDIGKPDTTRYRKGRITAYDHDAVGAILAKEFLEHFPCTEEFVKNVVSLVRWHMHILYVFKDLSFAKMDEMKKNVDIKELALLGLCDRLGRLNVNRKEEEENIRLFLKKSEETYERK